MDVVLYLVLGALALPVLAFVYLMAAANNSTVSEHYPGGVRVSGRAWPLGLRPTTFDRLDWDRVVLTPPAHSLDYSRPCPVRVRLGEREFGPAELADPAALRAAGAAVRRDVDREFAELSHPDGGSLWVTWDGRGRLVAVTVLAARGPGGWPCRVWVGDRGCDLPSTRPALREALGRPERSDW